MLPVYRAALSRTSRVVAPILTTSAAAVYVRAKHGREARAIAAATARALHNRYRADWTRDQNALHPRPPQRREPR
jgi:hypothetical protein